MVEHQLILLANNLKIFCTQLLGKKKQSQNFRLILLGLDECLLFEKENYEINSIECKFSFNQYLNLSLSLTGLAFDRESGYDIFIQIGKSRII